MTAPQDGRMLEHPAGAATAAHTIAQAIRARVPGWGVRVDGRAWITEDPDQEEMADPRWVIVATGQLAPADPRGRGLGPLIMGSARGVEVRVQLPRLIDSTDVRGALAALAALDILPEAPSGGLE